VAVVLPKLDLEDDNEILALRVRERLARLDSVAETVLEWDAMTERDTECVNEWLWVVERLAGLLGEIVADGEVVPVGK